MNKSLIFATLLSLSLVPGLLGAMTNEETEGRTEIEKGWVDRHNEKLLPEVRHAVKGLGGKKHSFFLSSRKKLAVRLRGVNLKYADKYGVPKEARFSKETMVPLASLYTAKSKGLTFLIADYADDWDPLHASSDIYLKIGFQYKPMFHGYGYRGCARILTLGKGSPLFFEMADYGGGANCQKTLYRLDEDTAKGMSDDLFDHPESVVPSDYVKKALVFNVWLEGFTLYKDVDKDGELEIVNCTQTEYPKELKLKVQDKYHQVDNEFGGPFRKVMTVFKWNKDKTKFEDIGDYYF